MTDEEYRANGGESGGSITHYGVKGMKWGVRKEYVPHPRQPGRSQYSTRRKRKTGTGTKQHGRRPTGKVTSKSKQRQMTEAQRARNRKIAKALLAAAGTAAVGAVAYKLYRENGKKYVDTVIKMGTEFQRVTVNPKEKLDRIYAVYKKGDKVLYRGRLGALRKAQTKGKVYSKTFSAIKEIRAPSDNKARDMMKQLMDSDSDFKKYVESIKSADFARLKTSPKSVDDHYYNFNLFGVMDQSENGQAQAKKFYDLLKKNGYNAITDLNDRKVSTFKANNPVILFDMGDVVEKTVKEMSTASIGRDLAVQQAKKIGQWAVPGMLGASGAALYAQSAEKSEARARRKGKSNGSK